MQNTLSGGSSPSVSWRDPAILRQIVWYAVAVLLISWCASAPLRDANLSFYFAFMMWMALASSFNFIAGFAGYMPFGFVAFYGLGAYGTGIAVEVIGLPIWLGVPFGGAVGVAFALLVAPSLRLSGIYFAIVSLALAIICQRVVALLPEWLTGGSLGMNLGVVADRVHGYYAMVLVLTGVLVTASWLARSRLGKALKAIRDDVEAADALGVDVARTRLKAWLLAAVFASLTGGVDAWFTGAFDTQTAFDVLVTAKTVIYAMAGGLGTVLGPVVGAGVLVWVDDQIWRAFPVLNNFLLGLIIVVLILFAPRGIIGSLMQRFPRLRRYVM